MHAAEDGKREQTSIHKTDISPWEITLCADWIDGNMPLL